MTPEPRLINRQTGGALLVSSTEAWLLRSWDGSASATRLSAAVFMNGVDIEPWQIEQFFLRLERLECLEGVRPRIPNFVGPRSGVSKDEDPVPRMRGDLLIVQAPRSRAVFHVKDPISNRAFSLLDTEVTVARMLDGKRKVRDVIENAGKLGIEVSLDSLQHFISHLKGYRFIDQDVEEGDSTWPKRKQWTEEERQLYQASMKMLREGHFAEALSFAESLEAVDPKSEEARQLKHRVEVEKEGIFELVAKFSVLHSTPSAATSKPALAEVAPPPSSAPTASPAEESAPALPKSAVQTFVAANKRLVAGVGGALLLALIFLRPVMVTQSVACELQVETLGTPRTMRGGKVGARDVELGAKVDKGAVLARLGGQSVEALDAKVKELEGQLKALPLATKSKKADAALAAVKKAQAAVNALEKSRKKGTKAQQAATEKKLAAKQRELEAAKKKADAFTHEATRAALEAELKLVKDKKAAIDAELAKSIIVAPVSGVFVSVGALPDELAVNDTFGVIVGPNFKLVTKETIPAVVEATFRAAALEAELAVVDGKPVFPVRAALVGAKGTLELKLGRKPWLATLF